MKKLLLAVLGLSVLVVPACAENKIQMVTYFPVPYVAYSKVTVDKQLDVGLTSSPFVVNLGKEKSQTRLNVTDTLTLQKGTLALNGEKPLLIFGGAALGKNGLFAPVYLTFDKNLRIDYVLNGYSLLTDNMIVGDLSLFPDYITNTVPSCSASGNKVAWKKLKFYKNDEVYLVCGD